MRAAYISNRFEGTKEVPVLSSLVLSFAFTTMLHVPLAVAQSNLGELLDAGAKNLSPEEFRQEVVQRVIVGPTPSGETLEVMYTSTGAIHGQSTISGGRRVAAGPISGEWTTDDSGRICSTLRIVGATQGDALAAGVLLPARCQYWYKLDQRYFFSDSDSDRSMRVLARTIKP